MTDRVIIAGAGFGGLETALRLREKNKKVEIIVIDKKSFFTYKASLHKLISGRSKKKRITIELEELLAKHRIKFYNDEVIQVKPLEKAVLTLSRKINFDYIVLSFGGVTNYFGVEGAKENSFELKEVLDSMKIKKHVMEEVEKAKYYTDRIKIIICGAGLTGVETAGELVDMTKGKAKIILAEANSTIMPGFDKKVIEYAEKVLKKKGVTIINNAHIKRAEKGKITLKDGTEMYSNVMVWCCGIKPNPLTHKTGLRTNDRGAIMVNEYLQTSHPHIYAIGDCAYLYKNPQPTTALIAIQEGKVTAHNINADITKGEKKSFNAEDWPYVITFGKGKAIMIKKKSVKTGLIPAIIKRFIEKNYLFTRKHWRWPINKMVLE
ncbi:NAD(P)/FAD-dependent oxidoreductase [Candidatus Woesearchaeota archaeon]|nr:NAD(P)/FAD-dependent oxidoreductase [Candidatus Woesearchaeota archaeon]